MSKACAVQPTPAARRKTQAAMIFELRNIRITVKSRDLGATGQSVHLDRFIPPREVIEITGGPEAPHTRIHTRVPAGRKYWRNYLA